MSASPAEPAPRSHDYHWAAAGDINAFFGLMLDNIGGMILMASLLVGVFGMPGEFVLAKMIPGTAVGVLVGDLIYTVMAFRLARRSGHAEVTAMPLGLDTPSTFGSVFLIIGPAFVAAGKRGLGPEEAATHAWFIGVAMLLASGLFKLGCALVSGWIRKLVPRAGLLGSLTAIALVIISFLPLLDIASQPVAGFVALAVILVTLTARWELPGKIPGALAGVLAGCVVYYGMHLAGLGPGLGAEGAQRPPRSAPCFRFRSAPGSRGSARTGARRCRSSPWRFRWPWRRSSGASTAPRAPRPLATTIPRARSSRPRGSRRSSPGCSAG